MIINERTAISTSKSLLIPYSKHHVPQYHKWMQDPAIQEATASEPLTITQEYAMQESWRKDGNKLTFIICKPLPIPEDETEISSIVQPGVHDNDEQMLGDVNLFLSLSNIDAAPESHVENNADADPHPNPPNINQHREVNVVGELELMIAEPKSQKKGYGSAALLTFLRYIFIHQSKIITEFLQSTTNISRLSATPTPSLSLTAKISATNTASLALFSRLAFTPLGDGSPNYFGEYELQQPPGVLDSEDALESLMERWRVHGYRELVYNA